jgi:hypothetical protein
MEMGKGIPRVTIMVGINIIQITTRALVTMGSKAANNSPTVENNGANNAKHFCKIILK